MTSPRQSWRNSPPPTSVLSGMLNIRSLALAGCVALAACGADSTAVPSPTPTPIATLGTWRLKSFDARQVPATYAEYFDQEVGDRIVRYTEFRMDSAVKEMRADSTYVRRYYHTEIQDGVVVFRYVWFDHGKFSIDRSTPARITLTSEFIQNLSTAGRVSVSGDIELSESLWLSEEPRNTVWVRH
jgi:hypothetical protein